MPKKQIPEFDWGKPQTVIGIILGAFGAIIAGTMMFDENLWKVIGVVLMIYFSGFLIAESIKK